MPGGCSPPAPDERLNLLRRHDSRRPEYVCIASLLPLSIIYKLCPILSFFLLYHPLSKDKSPAEEQIQPGKGNGAKKHSFICFFDILLRIFVIFRIFVMIVAIFDLSVMMENGFQARSILHGCPDGTVDPMSRILTKRSHERSRTSSFPNPDQTNGG